MQHCIQGRKTKLRVLYDHFSSTNGETGVYLKIYIRGGSDTTDMVCHNPKRCT